MPDLARVTILWTFWEGGGGGGGGDEGDDEVGWGDGGEDDGAVWEVDDEECDAYELVVEELEGGAAATENIGPGNMDVETGTEEEEEVEKRDT